MEENKVVNEVIDDADWASEGYHDEDMAGEDSGITLDELAAEADVEDAE
jgi:hypothetical protein